MAAGHTCARYLQGVWLADLSCTYLAHHELKSVVLLLLLLLLLLLSLLLFLLLLSLLLWVLQDDQAIEHIIMLLWQKLPSCVTKTELQLQLWRASHQIVSLTTGWFTECQRRVTHPQV